MAESIPAVLRALNRKVHAYEKVTAYSKCNRGEFGQVCDDERIKMGVCYAQTPKKLKAKTSGSFVSIAFLKQLLEVGIFPARGLQIKGLIFDTDS